MSTGGAGAPAAAGAPGTSGGLPPPSANATTKRLQQTQAQVAEVVDIMRVNVDKVLERDQKLSELDDRAEHLEVVSRQFESTATRVRRKYFWQNIKMWIILGGVVAVIVLVIVLAIVLSTRN